MATKDKKPVEQSDDRSIESEILAFIQVVNGLNEVFDDDVKFERVYRYIEMRYKEKADAKTESVRNAFVMLVLNQCEQLEATLIRVRGIAESENPDVSAIVVAIDSCLEEIKNSPKPHISDVNDYRRARKRSA